MTQDELNKELDGALTELVFNNDITQSSTGEDIKNALSCMVQFTEEQWQGYAVYCLQTTVENALRQREEREQ